VARNPNDFSVNERVSHPVYGLGTISTIGDLHTVIMFDQNGRRKFVTSMVQLEHSDAAPPKKTRARTREPKAKK